MDYWIFYVSRWVVRSGEAFELRPGLGVPAEQSIFRLMKDKLIVALFWSLALHLIVSAIFIFGAPLFKGTRLARVYKTYLLPGPFFTASRIVNNYSLSLSWKVNGTWSPTINPAKEAFNQYHASLNPTDLYRSRIARTLYLRLTLSDASATDIKNRKAFAPLKQFLCDHYVPREADSVRMWFINKKAEHVALKKDSILVTFTR